MDEGSEETIPNLENLTSRIGKYDSAMDKVADLHDNTLGTAEGPIQYDTSLIDKNLFPEYHAKAEKQVRGVKLQLATRTFEGLLEQRDALSDLHTRAIREAEEYRAAEQEYLTSSGTGEDDQKFDEAYKRLNAVKDEIASVFRGRERKKEIGSTNQEEQEDAEEPSDEQPQEGLVVEEKKEIMVIPAKIALDDRDLRHLEWISKVDMSRTPVSQQLKELAQKVAEVRTGHTPLPSVVDFVKANDMLDAPQQRRLVATSLLGLVSTHVLMPDGSLNPQVGLPQILATNINKLISWTNPHIVAEAIEDMPSVEKGLLCDSLSVAMKEKVGIPDLEFCDANTAASYFTNAMYDVLKPARDKRIERERRLGEKIAADMSSEGMVWHEPYYGRDTDLPIDIDELLVAINERDARDGRFSQAIIESMIRQNIEKGKSGLMENQKGILDNLFRELVEYCDEADLLGELQEFFSSSSEMGKYNRMISRRINFDEGQPVTHYA
jgi:hypothetical protein